MLVCLCQSFKQSVANDRTTNFFFSHPRVPRRRGVSVFSLFFPFFPFLFTLQIYLLYKLLRHCVDIQVCLLLTILAPDVSTPLFLPLSQLHAFHSSKVQFTSRAYDLIYTSRNARNIFPHSANFPLSLSLSLSILISEQFSRNDSAYTERRERDRLPKKSPSLSLSFYLQSFVSVDATIFFFFFRDLSIRSRDRSTSWYVYNVIFTDSLQKILCTVHEDCSVYAEFYATKTKIYDLSSHFLVSLEICLAFRVPFRFFLYITSND